MLTTHQLDNHGQMEQNILHDVDPMVRNKLKLLSLTDQSKCVMCSSTASEKDNINSRIQGQHGGNSGKTSDKSQTTCGQSICNSTASEKDNIKSHIQGQHGGNSGNTSDTSQTTCGQSICKSTASEKDNIKSHIQGQHGGNSGKTSDESQTTYGQSISQRSDKEEADGHVQCKHGDKSMRNIYEGFGSLEDRTELKIRGQNQHLSRSGPTSQSERQLLDNTVPVGSSGERKSQFHL